MIHGDGRSGLASPNVPGSARGIRFSEELPREMGSESADEDIVLRQGLADLVREPLRVDASGHVVLSERPGLGVELDSRIVAKYHVDR